MENTIKTSRDLMRAALKRIRLSRNMNQTQFSELVPDSRGSISLVESHKRTIGLHKVDTWLGALDSDLGELVDAMAQELGLVVSKRDRSGRFRAKAS